MWDHEHLSVLIHSQDSNRFYGKAQLQEAAVQHNRVSKAVSDILLEPYDLEPAKVHVQSQSRMGYDQDIREKLPEEFDHVRLPCSWTTMEQPA